MTQTRPLIVWILVELKVTHLSYSTALSP